MRRLAAIVHMCCCGFASQMIRMLPSANPLPGKEGGARGKTGGQMMGVGGGGY